MRTRKAKPLNGCRVLDGTRAEIRIAAGRPYPGDKETVEMEQKR